MMKKLLFVIWAFYSCTLFAQEATLPVFIHDSLDNYISRGMTKWKIPGLSVAIVKNGEVVYMKGFGVTSLVSKEPVNENTRFMIGSNTKAFTATAIAMLQEEGKLSINDKVKKWMPEFKLKDPLASQEIIIADLLSHRIGFETFQGDFTYWTSNLSREEVIQKMALIDAPYDFRTKWGYCNAAFLTAGQIIPRVTGKSWEATVREKIIVPLKMNHTLVLAEEFKKASNRATPYTLIDNELIELADPSIDNLAPAASISSSCSDMSIWLLTQLNNGKNDNVQVIPLKAIQALRKPYSIMGVDPRDKQQTHFFLYGLGLEMNDRNEKLVFSHTGGVDGFVSSVMFVPEEKLGIVVLTNTDQNNFFLNLTDEIRDAFLGLPYQDYSDKAFESFEKKYAITKAKMDTLRSIVELHNKPALPLDAFTGKYHNAVYGEIELKMEKGNLNIHFSHHPGMIGKLEYIQNDNFLCTYSNPTMGVVQIPFDIENGKVTGLTLRVNDFVEFTPYIFSKKE